MIKKPIESDFEFFAEEMPNYFITTGSSKKGEWIRCRSNFGIDENKKGAKSFDHLMLKFRNRWGERFIEVNHTVCTNHTDFTIQLKSQQ